MDGRRHRRNRNRKPEPEAIAPVPVFLDLALAVLDGAMVNTFLTPVSHHYSSPTHKDF